MPLHQEKNHRIQIIGCTNTGKSTLATRLSERHDIPRVELDALNWKPNWKGLHEHDPDAFRGAIQSAIDSPSFVVDGNYNSFSQEIIWPKLDTIYWLDLPLPILSLRLLRRSYRRWKNKEILWGTNTESFWNQLAIWRASSLLHWLWVQHIRQRQAILQAKEDPKWAHINFIHLKTKKQVNSI